MKPGGVGIKGTTEYDIAWSGNVMYLFLNLVFLISYMAVVEMELT